MNSSGSHYFAAFSAPTVCNFPSLRDPRSLAAIESGSVASRGCRCFKYCNSTLLGLSVEKKCAVLGFLRVSDHGVFFFKKNVEFFHVARQVFLPPAQCGPYPLLPAILSFTCTSTPAMQVLAATRHGRCATTCAALTCLRWSCLLCPSSATTRRWKSRPIAPILVVYFSRLAINRPFPLSFHPAHTNISAYVRKTETRLSPRLRSNPA